MDALSEVGAEGVETFFSWNKKVRSLLQDERDFMPGEPAWP